MNHHITAALVHRGNIFDETYKTIEECLKAVGDLHSDSEHEKQVDIVEYPDHYLKIRKNTVFLYYPANAEVYEFVPGSASDFDVPIDFAVRVAWTMTWLVQEALAFPEEVELE